MSHTSTHARHIAIALGEARREGRHWRCKCPIHGGVSLCLRDGATALLVKCFAGCETKDILAELRERGLVEGRQREQRPHRPPAPPRPYIVDDEHKRGQHQKATHLWSVSQPIEGTIADSYLRKARGITCPLPPTLRFLPPLKPEHHPAMIAAFAVPRECEPGVLTAPDHVDAVHLTLLRPDGSGKAEVDKPKLFIGSPGGWPIVIAPANDCLGLSIGEGIEDGLSILQATGLGAWAAGSAGRMPAMAATIPGYVETCTIWAHADQVGQAGALALAETLHQRGVEVLIANAGRKVRRFTFTEVLNRIEKPDDGGRRHG